MENKLRCLIIDDEPLARKVLREMAEDISFIEIISSCENVHEAEMILSEQKIDLIFLDIEMYETNGMQYLRHKNPASMVIITTAFPQYAVEGFELNVLDYLMKPISPVRLLKSALKAKDMRALMGTSNHDSHIFLKCEKKMEKIQLNTILYVKAMANYVIIQTDTRKYIAYMSFKSIETQLEGKDFYKTHRSYLVHRTRITEIGKEHVVVGDVSVPLVKKAKELLLEKMGREVLKRN